MSRFLYASLSQLDDNGPPFLSISLWDTRPTDGGKPLLTIESANFGEVWPFHQTGLNEEVIGVLSDVRSRLIRHVWRERQLTSPAPDEPTITVRRREPV